MKNENPNIFCQNCGNPAQPTPQASDRKNIILHDHNANEDYYLRLNDSQIDLLDYLVKEYIVDGNYEIIESHTFKVI